MASIAREPRADDARRATLLEPYVAALADAIDLDAIRRAGVEHRRGPAGRRLAGATGRRIAERYGLDLTVVNPALDPTFALHARRSRRQDPHGLLEPLGHGGAGAAQGPLSTWRGATTPTPTATASSRRRAGLLNPNHYLAVAIHYLLTHRPGWPRTARGGQDAGRRAR